MFYLTMGVVFGIAWRPFWEVLGVQRMIGDVHRMVAWLAVIVAVVLIRASDEDAI